ncbi:polysaccharide deacetylase [Bradyrhizobium ottawaense]|uniref:polysaccharide deacetylase family protein n=1 Tax=Bradyrhizobium ottawaense TaxID=931866 RepID=UPI000BE94EC0|nr:polysaccharide deacetylase [Bradyrhizobium ottawaense]PDT64363.1 polysaccharide deacetylase [Bradyrhizobium ottawaense]
MSDTRLTVCLTYDVDGMSAWLGSFRSNNPSMISRGEYTIVATPRILNLLKQYEIRATFCIPGHTVCAYPDLVKLIRDNGHEIGHHGWVHENPASFDRAGERRNLELGLEALDRVGVKPVGYRSPAWDFGVNTIELLNEFGFLYDSSFMGHDFYPYYLRSQDRWSFDRPYEFGIVSDLIDLPVTWGLDDYPAFEVVPGTGQGYAAPSAIEEIWWGDFEYALNNCPGGVYVLTMHPEFIARGHRITMLDRLIRRFAECDGVRFATMAAYASAWKADNPKDVWAEQNPLRTGRDSICSLGGRAD